MNLKEVLNYGKKQLNDKDINNSIILKVLIEHIFKIKKEQIVIYGDMELSTESVNEFKLAIKKIIDGVPIQYITNNQEFMKLSFYVDENVLIPQPDTEIVVEEVINEYKNKKCKILDLCTGSGAIAISLAKYIPNANIHATDISMKAIQIAKLNAEKNLVKKNITFYQSNMFESIKEHEFDIIVSNPPYIKTSVINYLDEQVKNEPHLALDGGEDGLKFYKIIAESAYKYLKKGGKLFLEIGYDQKLEVISLLRKSDYYKNIYAKKDYGQNDRMIVAEKRD